MKFFKQFRKYGVRAIFGTSLATGANIASAAVPAGVTDAMADAAADAATIGGLALVAVVAAVAFKYVRRGL
jgi:hypothetical protein